MDPFDTRHRENPSPIASKTRLTSNKMGIGANIRFMRRQRRMSLDELAGAAGITKSYLSKIERGISVPSIAVALKVANSFAVSIGQLLGEEPGDESICIVRRDERKRVMRDGSNRGYNYEMLAAAKRFKAMEPFIMRPPSEFQGEHFFEHIGEEFILVLSGAMEIEFSNQRVTLEKGDAVYFDSLLPHRSRSLGEEATEALVIVMS